jgi:hypothetical protein
VHQDDGGSPSGGQLEDVGVGVHAPDIVDEVGSRFQRGGGNRGLCRVDAQRRVGQGGAKGGDHGHDPSDLVDARHVVMTGSAGLAAHVEQIRTLGHHPAADGDGRCDRIVDFVGHGCTGPTCQQAVARKGVRGRVDDPHDIRATAPREFARPDPGRAGRSRNVCGRAGQQVDRWRREAAAGVGACLDDPA